jgi:putative transposase
MMSVSYGVVALGRGTRFTTEFNLLGQDFAAEAPDQKWSADTSCIRTKEGWLYLALLIHLFLRRMVGWAARTR